MIMDPRFTGISDYSNDFDQAYESNLLAPDLYLNQYPDTMYQLQFKDPSLDLYSITDNISFVPSNSFPYSILTNNPGWSPEGDPFVSSPSLSGQNEASASSSSASWSHDCGSPSDDGSDPVLKFISQMLLEENMGEKPSMFHDHLALQAAEKSLSAVLTEENPSPFPKETQFLLHQNVVDCPNGTFSASSSDYGEDGNRFTSSSTGNSIDPHLSANLGNNYPLTSHNSPTGDHVVQSTSQSFKLPESQAKDAKSLVSSVNEFLLQNVFSNSESVLQFRKGLEEASKFLPEGNQLVSDLGNNMLAPGRKEGAQSNERENSFSGLMGRTNHKREDVDLEEGRNNKQAAVYPDETELSEMFDRVLLIPVGKSPPSRGDKKSLQNGATKDLQQNGQSDGYCAEQTHGKKQSTRKEPVDLRTLLLQAVSPNDSRTSDELLKQIRQHSSPLGNGSQRLAHYFADGLEARLDGSAAGIQNFYSSTISKRSAADMLKAYHSYLSVCPFKKIAIFFANKMILSVAEKATTLHIIDFGIMYGFQWPVLIQHLSERSGGPPKLRVTGIELPQHGFRPAQRVEDTGRRLEKYCKRFNVPFKYNGIAADNWENIQIKDLQIDSNEVVAVNCLFRFKNLLDETVDVNSPRNAVLNLIKKMNPDIFIHAIANGFYNAPFFASRCREAIFHYSALFDMFDAIASREDQERLMFEREFYGRAIMNITACEGSQRVERPETYKQWQVRTLRAGFRQLPLDQDLMMRFRAKYKAWYHKDFLFNEDSNWMLQGWKGRVLYASSCWVRS